MRTDFRKKTAVLVLVGLLLSATASVAAEASAATGGASAPGASAPAPRAKRARKAHATAIATWFGPGFYGQRTACGQTLTPAVIGVAHRTLPCGTLVKVVYKGQALTVPVLDRGPYSHIGADWDLTAGAASALGITETVRIATRVVGSTANTPTLGLPAAPPASALTGGAVSG
ncbi:MAG TPA: septal ring lytic transglycosylase RlpA family protein [Solirubrobacteraceae bacterium]|jgi:rare lipoprotein A (peptidoglycan hydrolase)|nr:septal ring lytic transglycosylase RlpA family protein [Solirubrobacteraceae bacterium]